MHQGREAVLKTQITFAQLLIVQPAMSLTQEWKPSTTVQNVEKLVHRLVRYFHSRSHHLAAARHRQGSSTRTPSLWVQFVIVLVMKAPRAGRRVAWKTNRDSTRTMATKTRTALEKCISSSPQFTT